MMRVLRAAWDWMLSDQVILTSPGIDRVFMKCVQCGRIRPAYDLLKKPPYKRIGCKCGARQQRPTNVSEWLAAWWVLGVGVVWRKWIRRLPNWDPRIPMRRYEKGEF